MLGAAAPAAACELADGRRIQGAKHSIAYRTLPARIVVGEPFVVEISVCPQGRVLGADAQMPEHRHGMNYRPTVAPLGGGRYRAEGWVFHMRGRWEFVFDVEGERLADSQKIE